MSQIGGIKNPPCQSKQGGTSLNTTNINQEYFTMNEIQCKSKLSEIISLATPAKSTHNGVLSQKLKAVMPNGLNWLFLRPNTGVNPSYTGNVVTLYFPFMVWLILQNKPVGEYVKRYLCKPRVRPHRPFLGLLTQNYKGASIMTAFLTGILAKLSHFTPTESLVLGFIIGLPLACLVVGILSVMGV